MTPSITVSIQDEKKTHRVSLTELIHLLHQKNMLLTCYHRGLPHLHHDLPLVTAKHQSYGLSIDSKDTIPTDIFIAIKGGTRDSHTLIPDLHLNGIQVFIVEQLPPDEVLKTLDFVFVVKDSRKSYGMLWAMACSNPQEHLNLLGVTGTNGKTTTVWLIKELLKQQGIPTLTFTTMGIYLGDQMFLTTHTTPDAWLLFGMMAKAVKSGIKVVIMEASSHALIQNRLCELKFDTIGMTSFSQDHLDFHKDMKSYWEAKMKLFDLTKDHAKAFVSDSLKAASFSYPIEWYSVRLGESHGQSLISFEDDGQIYSGTSSLIGRHNAQNLTLASKMIRSVGYKIIPKDWIKLSPCPGRLEQIKVENKDFYVDYAHTPDALLLALIACKKKLLAKGKLYLVFGCGGNRDQDKRSQMGKVAGLYADYTIITNDNPRFEDPKVIAETIGAGLKTTKAQYEICLDRKQAIYKAFHLASTNDIILVAGKGHESTMEIEGEKTTFSDQDTIKGLI